MGNETPNIQVEGTAVNKKFRDIVDVLEGQWQTLLMTVPVNANDVPNDTPVGGVYLFSEHGVHLYTGRTKRRIALRIRYHFSTARDSPFAWLLARKATGMRATYRPSGSRRALLDDPTFEAEYERAKEQIRRMHVRWVHEPDPLRQALLEIYVAIASQARYNDFDTH
jgi:hypothetical protein